jgi:hypothetical protein
MVSKYDEFIIENHVLFAAEKTIRSPYKSQNHPFNVVK